MIFRITFKSVFHNQMLFFVPYINNFCIKIGRLFLCFLKAYLFERQSDGQSGRHTLLVHFPNAYRREGYTSGQSQEPGAPPAWAFTHDLPTCFSRKWHHQQSSQNLNWHSASPAVTTMSSLKFAFNANLC